MQLVPCKMKTLESVYFHSADDLFTMILPHVKYEKIANRMRSCTGNSGRQAETVM